MLDAIVKSRFRLQPKPDLATNLAMAKTVNKNDVLASPGPRTLDSPKSLKSIFLPNESGFEPGSGVKKGTLEDDRYAGPVWGNSQSQGKPPEATSASSCRSDPDYGSWTGPTDPLASQPGEQATEPTSTPSASKFTIPSCCLPNAEVSAAVNNAINAFAIANVSVRNSIASNYHDVSATRLGDEGSRRAQSGAPDFTLAGDFGGDQLSSSANGCKEYRPLCPSGSDEKLGELNSFSIVSIAFRMTISQSAAAIPIT
ncbi:unnamed protein product [Protopolystoma xenopodis]|uniref:Uncharacterized protein n=1 Tax=Protopolystoma xenopodis TaxID=117903 RepID=A0A448XMY8_9PLAT|nr:unnamed protein product [Protopolystoma xenopodis]